MTRVLLTVPNSKFTIPTSFSYTSPPLEIGYITSFLSESGGLKRRAVISGDRH